MTLVEAARARPDGIGEVMGMAQQERDERLARAFVELADTLVDGFHLVDFLYVLIDHVTDLLEVEAAGVVMADSQLRLIGVTASTGSAHTLEEVQLEFDEGPCRDCYLEHRGIGPVDLTTPAAAERWPHFTPAARAAGGACGAALPLHLREEVIGALNLFHTRADALQEADLRLGQALADAATIGILHQRLAGDQGERISQLQTALNSRIAIEQAKGALGARLELLPDAAFDRLRAHARAHRLSLTRLCEQVVQGTADPALFTLRSDTARRD